MRCLGLLAVCCMLVISMAATSEASSGSWDRLNILDASSRDCNILNHTTNGYSDTGSSFMFEDKLLRAPPDEYLATMRCAGDSGLAGYDMEGNNCCDGQIEIDVQDRFTHRSGNRK